MQIKIALSAAILGIFLFQSVTAGKINTDVAPFMHKPKMHGTGSRNKKFLYSQRSLRNKHKLAEQHKNPLDESEKKRELFVSDWQDINQNNNAHTPITYGNQKSSKDLKTEAKKASFDLLECTKDLPQNHTIRQCAHNAAVILQNIFESGNEEMIKSIDKIDKEIRDKRQNQSDFSNKKSVGQRLSFKENHPVIYRTLLTLLGTITYVALDSQLHFTFSLGITNLSDYLSIWEFIEYLPYTSVNSIVPTATELLKAHTLPYLSFNALLNIPTIISYVKCGFNKIKNFIRR